MTGLTTSSKIGRFDETLGLVVASFPHGLLVVSDPTSRDSHDDWDSAREVVHAGADSLYVATRPAASGLVSVVVAERGAMNGGAHLLYDGEIALPSLAVRVYEPNESFHLDVLVQCEANVIKVYGDDREEPSEVVILVQAA